MIDMIAFWKIATLYLVFHIAASNGSPFLTLNAISQPNTVKFGAQMANDSGLRSDFVPTFSPLARHANVTSGSDLPRKLGKHVEDKQPKNKNKDKWKDKAKQTKTTPKPSAIPSINPSWIPSSNPTSRPSIDSTSKPSTNPSAIPSFSFKPTSSHSQVPSITSTPTISRFPSASPSSSPSASPTMYTTIQLELSVGIKISTKDDATSVLKQVIETTNMTDKSEAILSETFEKLRESELKDGIISAMKNSLNKDVNNLVVRDNDDDLRNGRIRNRRLNKKHMAQIILLGNIKKETSFYSIDDFVLTSVTNLTWYRTILKYTVWYEDVTFDHDPEVENGNIVIPKDFDKKNHISDNITPFSPNDTGTLVEQLNVIIAKLINSQKLVKALYEEEPSIVSVSLPDQEAQAQQFSVPTAEPTIASADEVAMLMVRNKYPLNKPLDIEKMGPLRIGGISLFTLTSIFAVGLYILSKKRRKQHEEHAVHSFSSQEQIEFVLEASRCLPTNLNIPCEYDDNPSCDTISQMTSSHKSQASSHFSSTYSPSGNPHKLPKHRTTVSPIQEDEKFSIIELNKLPSDNVDDCVVSSKKQFSRLLEDLKRSSNNSSFL